MARPRKIPLEDGSKALLPVLVITGGLCPVQFRRMIPTWHTHDLLLGMWVLLVLFATATDRITHLPDAHRAGRLPHELARLRRYGLIIVDEVGYLPFQQDAANLFFQLVSSRYEHASLISTSNLPLSGWGGVFGDQAVAAAMIDRVVHRADVPTLEGASYRLRNRGIDTLPSIKTHDPSAD